MIQFAFFKALPEVWITARAGGGPVPSWGPALVQVGGEARGREGCWVGLSGERGR